MITYYLIGNWMGSFRTVSTTETLEDFLKWKEEYNFILDKESKIFRSGNSKARIVIESISNEDRIKLGNPKIGI